MDLSQAMAQHAEQQCALHSTLRKRRLLDQVRHRSIGNESDCHCFLLRVMFIGSLSNFPFFFFSLGKDPL